MKISDLFTSKFIQAGDVREPRILTIESVTIADFNDGKKPALHFIGEQRALVLNKSNAFRLTEELGDETENWVGVQVVLRPTEVMFQGRLLSSILVEVLRQSGNTAPVSSALSAKNGTKTRAGVVAPEPDFD